MNKKVLVLTLALVVAFATSAFAEVKFEGELKFEAKQESFKLFNDKYSLKPSMQLNISATNKNSEEATYEKVDVWVQDELYVNDEGKVIRVTGYQDLVTDKVKTEETLNWELDARIPYAFGNLDKWDTSFTDYRLHLQDQYFEAWAWGGGTGDDWPHPDHGMTDIGTHFDMIKASKHSRDGKDGHRARIAVPVSVAKLTADFDGKGVRAFVKAEIAEDTNVGLAVRRTDFAGDSINNVVAEGDTKVAAGDLTLALKAAAGISYDDKETGFAVGVGADTDLLEDKLALDASVKFANDKWAGDGVDAKEVVIGGGASYTEDNFRVAVSDSHKVKAKENTLQAALYYRATDTLAFGNASNKGGDGGQLFKDTEWMTNDGLAAGAGIKLVNFKDPEIWAKVSSPVVEDVAWVKAEVEYKGKDDYDANVLGYIIAMNAPVEKKLVVEPSVGYASVGKVIDLKVSADYKIGLSDNTINLSVQKVMVDKEYAWADGADPVNAKEEISVSVTLPF